jgi:[ribosomal protein S18]-alanine N-acetyltransferase
MSHRPEQVRLLTVDDIPAIERLLHTSEYVYQRFTQEELLLLMKRYPAVGVFNRTSLHGFLLSQSINPPSAWIGGFGVSWTESRAYPRIFSSLLDSLSPYLLEKGVQYLHYSGNNVHRDWLRSVLLAQGFFPYCQLYAYDKFDYGIPTRGNAQVTIRPVNIAKDMAALLTLEELCFDDLWRYNAVAFADIAVTHPYFVVAELKGNIVGYQFNALDDNYGYLVRIAVHPSFEHQGIGARLMAEAIRFFQQGRVSRIMLNSQENNHHAHRLYEWFGFVRVEQMGFVLQKYLAS